MMTSAGYSLRCQDRMHIVLAALLLLLPFSLLSQPEFTDTTTIARVNGEPVAAGEFLLVAGRFRAQVISEFRDPSETGTTRGFWKKKIRGTTPQKELERRTIDALISIKVQQECAKKAGLVRDISYAGFLRAFETENERRLTADLSGRVIYGPAQYSREVYYDYLFTNLVIRLREHLAAEKFTITREMLTETYNKEKENYFRKGYCTEISLVKCGMNGDADSSYPIPESANNTTFVYCDTAYSPEEEEPFTALIKEKARGLNRGENSGIFSFRGSDYRVTVIKREFMGYRDPEECGGKVQELLINGMYEHYVRDLQSRAKCKIIKRNFNMIKPEA